VTYSVHQAKSHFSKLLDLVESGEEIIILRHGKAVAQLVSPRTGKKPVLGSLRGQIQWTEGWEKPLTDHEADAFLEGRP
jgi:prevent-host-death family protein